jgi:hypothetical protein
MFPINLLPGAISEILAVVRDTHQITKADRYGLMAAILDESISEEDRFSLDRLIRSIYRGRVNIVDELSTVL